MIIDTNLERIYAREGISLASKTILEMVLTGAFAGVTGGEKLVVHICLSSLQWNDHQSSAVGIQHILEFRD
jgi:hypothetical protein